MLDEEKNVTRVKKEDRDFIRSLMALPPEKQVLIQGIIIGMNLKNKTPG